MASPDHITKLKRDSLKRKILLCTTKDDLRSDDSDEVVVARSSYSCMHKALKDSFDFIAVVFTGGPLREHKALVALCAALRRNPDTTKVSLLSILTKKHPILLKWLRQVQVQYALVTHHEAINLREYLELLPFPPTDDHKLERILAEFCPYIHYTSVNSQREMAFCAAYQNWLLLGQYGLSRGCETTMHRKCEYFRNPRLR
ncbi:MAG: hypothetical protein JSV10_05065 [Candidatus Zixiibacteriota bacterium]|nr:MAG: hypothetical protein JSV10_05065 [candidate division Zixibacteria bacterium]